MEKEPSYRINYMIASYGGIYNQRHNLNHSNEFPQGEFLRNHLIQLAKLVTNYDPLETTIHQITIMKPRINKEHQIIHDYYNFEDIEIDSIRAKIKVVECENLGASYNQLFRCLFLFKNYFDYTIFTEDDYIPYIGNFDRILVNKLNSLSNNLHTQHNQHFYLCSGILRPPQYEWQLEIFNEKFPVADFSLGIISKNTVNHIFRCKDYNEIRAEFVKYKNYRLAVSQVIFSKILYDLNIQLCDWCDDHLSIFYENQDNKYYLLNYEYPNDWCITRKSIDSDKKYKLPIFIPIQAQYSMSDELINMVKTNYIM